MGAMQKSQCDFSRSFEATCVIKAKIHNHELYRTSVLVIYTLSTTFEELLMIVSNNIPSHPIIRLTMNSGVR